MASAPEARPWTFEGLGTIYVAPYRATLAAKISHVCFCN